MRRTDFIISPDSRLISMCQITRNFTWPPEGRQGATLCLRLVDLFTPGVEHVEILGPLLLQELPDLAGLVVIVDGDRHHGLPVPQGALVLAVELLHAQPAGPAAHAADDPAGDPAGEHPGPDAAPDHGTDPGDHERRRTGHHP